MKTSFCLENQTLKIENRSNIQNNKYMFSKVH